jgi:hypothetical protein
MVSFGNTCLYLFSYQLDDLEAERKYQVSLNASICLEAHQPCAQQYIILQNTKLPKVVCDWGPQTIQG